VADGELTCRLGNQHETVGEVSLFQQWIEADGAHATRAHIAVRHLPLSRRSRELGGRDFYVTGLDLVSLAPQGFIEAARKLCAALGTEGGLVPAQ
jgi:hypothetical protein